MIMDSLFTWSTEEYIELFADSIRWRVSWRRQWFRPGPLQTIDLFTAISSKLADTGGGYECKVVVTWSTEEYIELFADSIRQRVPWRRQWFRPGLLQTRDLFTAISSKLADTRGGYKCKVVVTWGQKMGKLKPFGNPGPIYTFHHCSKKGWW